MNTIYEPKGRAREYSELALNLYTGCKFGCRYCFNRFTPWYDDKVFNYPAARKDFLIELDKKAAKMAGTQTEILFCFTCDPYPGEPLDILTREALLILEKYKLLVQVLSKAGTHCARDFDILSRNGWRYGVTITGSPESSQQWEPFAAPIHDRMLSLELAKNTGISTFVSFEPVVDPDYCVMLMRSPMFRAVVDEFRIGKMNYVKAVENAIHWGLFYHMAKNALKDCNKPVIFKTDLLEAAHGHKPENTENDSAESCV